MFFLYRIVIFLDVRCQTQLCCMTELSSIFRELGLTQYLDIFIEQGFDTWETILDITESDLYVWRVLSRAYVNSNINYSDALGVKLGHRRAS